MNRYEQVDVILTLLGVLGTGVALIAATSLILAYGLSAWWLVALWAIPIGVIVWNVRR